MPKERKQRGRRNKKQDPEDVNEASGDVLTQEEQFAQGEAYNGDAGEHESSANFFGLLDESEQTYFKTIDDAMIADEFTNIEERDIFVENVYREAEGKELKLATSPLGSKVLEQLLARSKAEQIRRLFKTYQGNFHTLIRQRYASHVCEMLFAIASTLVSSEMAQTPGQQDDDQDEPYVSTENLFLYMYNEIASDVANLGADAYASHVIRDILLALQGTLFTFEEAKGQAKRYHGQKKFSWARPDKDLPVPAAFKDELRNTMTALSSLPSAQLRMTASQPYSVSFVQVLIAIEASLQDENDRPILFSLLGGQDFTERDDYIESILREPSGSKLFETIITAVPSNHFGKFYECYFKDRIAKFAQNPITNFVVQKLMTSCRDSAIISEIKDELLPVFTELVQLNHLQVLQKLIEACGRTKTETEDVMQHIIAAFDCTSETLVQKILETPVPPPASDGDRPPRRMPDAGGKSYNMQGAFLITCMLDMSPACHAALASSILSIPGDILLSYTKAHAPLKVLEAFLLHADSLVPDKKRLLNHFFTHFAELANDAVSSRFVDTCWSATLHIKLYKDRIAQELVEAADLVRGNYYGRMVWRNWNMDLYKNKRGEWNHLVKQAGAKETALAKLQERRQVDQGQRNGQEPPQSPQQPGVMTVNAEREKMIEQAAKPSRRERKRQRRQKDAVEDEVDDIFKKRKL